MEMTECQQIQVIDRGACLMKTRERATASINQDARDAVDPYEI